MLAAPSPKTRIPHPSVFMILIIPFGLASGFLQVAMGYELVRAGVGTAAIAGLIAASFLPHTWKFLWAPLVDTTWTRKRWYFAANLVSGIGLAAGGLLTQGKVNMGLLTLVVVLANFSVTVVSQAIEGLMGGSVPDEQRGRVSGWFQAGNLGGAGLGGGLGLWLIESGGWSTAQAAVALSVACLACCLALRWLDEPAAASLPEHNGVGAQVREVLSNLWALARSRTGALAMLICFLPIGSAGSSSLWSAVGGEWHASSNAIALVNGALGGVISALGCLVGGWICDRMSRRGAYALFGGLLALCAVAMALSPRTSFQFVLWTSVYAFVNGFCFAGYSAVVLEAIGSTLAATKFSLLASLSNIPIGYSIWIAGQTHRRWGSSGMLMSEAALGAFGLLIFFTVAGVARRHSVLVAPVVEVQD